MMIWILGVFHVLGVLSSLHSLMTTRTPQGTIAWLACLNTVPLIAVPAYWVLGRSRFKGYVIERRAIRSTGAPIVAKAIEQVLAFRPAGIAPTIGERLADLPLLGNNEVELLIDGEKTFDSILAGIARAKESVLVQFYIVHDDGIGRRMKAAMIERAQAGVRVHFLFDEIGSHSLPRAYLTELRAAGVHVSSFHTTRGSTNRFQLNFRNHRKIVVVDGVEGWVGGHNVGDEYLGLDPKIGPWRDTHMRLRGPAVTGLVISFSEDWHWATDVLLLDEVWKDPVAGGGDAAVLILPTGPADRLETASLMYQQAIQTAKIRVWIASPYFVPDQAVMHALHLAALRGVDVRIVIPDHADKALVYYSAFAFLGELLESGVRVYRHKPGFLHEKVFVVDDVAAGVGTANFDNRSFRLNFEVTAVVLDDAFIADVHQMFLHDFDNSREMSASEVEEKSFWFRLASRAAYLTTPVQ